MASIRPSLRVPYKTLEGVDIPTDIYLPSSTTSSKPCPVLIMIHGGAFMLGDASMNNKDQISDCLDRGWIVLGVEHRLCPGVNVLEGPMTDVRDSLGWVQDGGLSKALQAAGEGSDSQVQVDGERVMVMGTSSGGHLALCTVWQSNPTYSSHEHLLLTTRSRHGMSVNHHSPFSISTAQNTSRILSGYNAWNRCLLTSPTHDHMTRYKLS